MPDMTGCLDSKRGFALASGSAGLLWAAQPPLGWWPFAFVALIPWLRLAATADPLPRFFYRSQWLAATGFWLLSLQGLRHAHPLMFLCWIALAGYLAVYLPLFVAVVRRLVVWGVPLVIAAPIAWVGWECVRNYALTGISAAMLGHTLADLPVMIQVADLFGSYGVSFVIVIVNAALFLLLWGRQCGVGSVQIAASTVTASVVLLATVGYGQYRLGQPTGPAMGTIALIQRDEQTEYEQDRSRELEIYRRYIEQSLEAVRKTEVRVDAVVWPESMFSGGLPWTLLSEETAAPQEFGYSQSEFRALISESQQRFLQRATDLQTALANENKNGDVPSLIGGCAVVHYASSPGVYSGVVMVSPDGQVNHWYGKSHLVMFGEYIPLIGSIPGLRDYMPPGMGLQIGSEPQRFPVGSMTLSPNICIETAVERVTVNQLRRLRSDTEGSLPDAIVNVTNDAWFDGSSVVAHHLRCSQLVAVGCRRPLLSAGNGGPTAWIDSSGRIVEALNFREHGWIIARPELDSRTSLYVRIGDLPAKLMGMVVCLVIVWAWIADGWIARRIQRRGRASGESLAETN